MWTPQYGIGRHHRWFDGRKKRKKIMYKSSWRERLNICEHSRWMYKVLSAVWWVGSDKKKHYTGIRLSYIHEDSGVNSKRKWRKIRRIFATCMTCNHKWCTCGKMAHSQVENYPKLNIYLYYIYIKCLCVCVWNRECCAVAKKAGKRIEKLHSFDRIK